MFIFLCKTVTSDEKWILYNHVEHKILRRKHSKPTVTMLKINLLSNEIDAVNNVTFVKKTLL